MAYDIKIKGFPNLVSVENGEQAKLDWENYINTKKNAVVNIGDWTGQLSDISSFRKVSGGRGKDNKTVESVAREYRANLVNFRKLSVEDKAKRLGFFRLLYWGFTREKSENVKLKDGSPIEEKAIAIQRKFFAENPKRMFCDVINFKQLIKSNECFPAVMSIMEEQIRQDVFSLKYIN